MKYTIFKILTIGVFLLPGCGTQLVETPVSTLTPPQEEEAVEVVTEIEPTATTVPATTTAINMPPTATATEVLPTPTQVPALEFEISSEIVLHGSFIIDENHSLAVGLTSRAEDVNPLIPVLMLTTDGGRNWADVETGLEIGDLNSVTFTDAVTGYAAGQDYNDRTPVILRTEDGGQTWKKAIGLQTQAMVNEVYFSPAGIGWAIGFYENGGSLLMRSEDGITWVEQDLPSSAKAGLNGITFPSEEVGYAVGGSPPYLIKTMDGGVTWNELEVPLQEAFLYDVLFFDDLHGVVVGGFSEDSGVILVTEDGGESWTVSKFSGSSVYLRWIFRYRGTLIVFGNDCGDNGCSGLVLKSKDKGETWEELPHLDGSVKAIGRSNIAEDLVVFAFYTDAYASIRMTHWEYFSPDIGDD